MDKTPPIWIVDDDPSIRFVLEKVLQRERLPVRSFSHPAELRRAWQALHQPGQDEPAPRALISDIRMPGESGLDLLRDLHAERPDLPIIIMTAFSDLDSTVSAFQGGAFEYLVKPFDVARVVELIHRAIRAAERETTSDDVATAMQPIPGLLGQGPAMQDVFKAIGRLSQSLVTVLVTGESGTGKEMVAHALHRHSPVAQGPFVAINTAAIPGELLESELFGHERGAFTGAQSRRQGRFEQADGGTLLLDEIGDMPLGLQTRLLRVLSEGQFYRVGGHTPVKTRVRIIAATHQNLEQRVASGLFREDLFHRLNVIRLHLPALRERPQDIALLAQFFLQKSAQQLGVEPKRLTAEAQRALQAFSFPGNVRQLENICHWLTVMAPAQSISASDLPPEILQPRSADDAPQPAAVEQTQGRGAGLAHTPAPLAGWEAALQAQAERLLDTKPGRVWDMLHQQFEKTLIRAALHATNGRRIEAAGKLGIGRNTITRKIQELGLDESDESLPSS